MSATYELKFETHTPFIESFTFSQVYSDTKISYLIGNDIIVSFSRNYSQTSLDFEKGRYFNHILKTVNLIKLLKTKNTSLITQCSYLCKTSRTTYTGDITVNNLEIIINTNTELELPENFSSNIFIQKILTLIEKDKDDPRYYSVINLLFSCVSENSDIQKFMALWIGINGFYGYISRKLLNYFYSENHVNRLQEYIELDIFCLFQNWWVNTNENDSSKQLQELNEKTILKIIYNNFTTLSDEVYEMISQKLQELYPNTTISPEGYIFRYITYKQRCDLFHGSKKQKLFIYNKNKINKAIRFCSKQLIDVINTYISNWIDDDYIITQANETREKIKSYLEASKIKKNLTPLPRT